VCAPGAGQGRGKLRPGLPSHSQQSGVYLPLHRQYTRALTYANFSPSSVQVSTPPQSPTAAQTHAPQTAHPHASQGKKFSNVLCIVALHSFHTRALTFEILFASESAPRTRRLESPQKRLESPQNAAADEGARAAAAVVDRRAGLMIAVSDSLLAQGLEGEREGEREGEGMTVGVGGGCWRSLSSLHLDLMRCCAARQLGSWWAGCLCLDYAHLVCDCAHTVCCLDTACAGEGVCSIGRGSRVHEASSSPGVCEAPSESRADFRVPCQVCVCPWRSCPSVQFGLACLALSCSSSSSLARALYSKIT
jgi:hypothetical protein